MSLYQHYSLPRILLRRVAVVAVGVLIFPLMVFCKARGKYYSYLHRVWSKTSTKPVWLAQSEGAHCDFY